MRHLIRAILFPVVILLLVPGGGAESAPPPAGTVITNRAEAAYTDANRDSFRISTNSVSTVIQSSSPELSITLSASPTELNQGETGRLDITVTNSGSADALAAPVTIDGTPATAVIASVNVPLDSSLVFVTPGSSQPLYHRAGDPPGTYLSIPPTDLTLVDRVAFALPRISPGESVSLSVTVRFTPASGGSRSTATASVTSSDGNTVTTRESATVVFTLPPPPFTIDYYRDAAFDATTSASPLGSPLFIQASASICNGDAGSPQTREITLTSELTGDRETFTAQETGPNTGLFRITPPVPTRDGSVTTVERGNGVMELSRNDRVTASITGCGTTMTATSTILIDPYGVLFDSRTNLPVSGASVTLIDTATGNRAAVLLPDGVTTAPNPVTTGADGSFQFPLVAGGTYRLQVVPTGGHLFPSTVPAGSLPAGRAIHPTGSYGGDFTVSAATGAVRIDIPVDPTGGGLFVDKRASRSEVEPADLLDYTVQVRNSSAAPLTGVTLEDILPRGFRYRNGSTRIDGLPAPDPLGGGGPRLTFTLGTIPGNGTVSVTYRVIVGAGALSGNGVNTARASASGGIVSNVASARVSVVPGVFTDRGIILGKVFLDCDRNRLQGEKEIGIPGVRIILDDGTSVVTDREGKYSLYGISPRTHVLKLDETTLPAGIELEVLDNRHAGDAASRFVDLKKGELHRADFAGGACTPSVVRQVVERHLRNEQSPTELLRAAQRLSVDDTPPGDVRSRPAGGMLDQPFPAPLTPGYHPPPSASSPAAMERAALSDYLETVPPPTPEIAFFEPSGETVVPTRQIRVLARGSLASPWKLRVNGVEIPEKRIGTRVRMEEAGIEGREYVGVDLSPGDNRLELVQYDPFGNERLRRSITVTAPGDVTSIGIDLPADDIRADGREPVPVTVTLRDSRGTPVTTRAIVTLEATAGRFATEDLDPSEPGIQTIVSGGSNRFILIAPQEPGTATLSVSTGTLRENRQITFLPELRPLVAVGHLEGTINLRRGLRGGILPVTVGDGFEQEIRGERIGNGSLSAGGRASLYLKGKIKGDYLLTLAYDSDKRSGERLFRDIQPDQYYPVYGDDSQRAFDAQSTSRMYVRIDKNRSWLLYGDFTTQSAPEVRQLGAYNRSLTGVRWHYESPFASLYAFASDDSTRQVIDELPGKGVSGPYYPSSRDLVPNSEKIEIVTRDRNQPSIVLKKVPLSRFSDYEMDSFTGAIILKSPLSTLDADLNPLFLRVTYETLQGGKRFWVGGVDAQTRPHERVEIGGSFVRDADPQDPSSLASANLTLKLLDKTYLMAELARSEKESVGTGTGRRIELKHDGTDLQLKIHGVTTSTTFENPSSAIGGGREEAGFKGRYRVSDQTAIAAEGLYSADSATGGRRRGILAGIERTIVPGVKGEIGVRHVNETATPSQPGSGERGPVEFTSLRGRLGTQSVFLPELGLFAEYEQALDHPAQRIAAAGGEYRLGPRSRAYARHEFISSLGSPYGLNDTQRRNLSQIGIETEYMKDGTLFSEYRIRDSLSGRESEAALGLKNLWTVAPGVRLSTGLERIAPVGGPGIGSSTALTSGVEWTGSERWKGSARLEYRTDQGGRSWLNTAGVAHKLNREITLIGRHLLTTTDGRGGSADRLQERIQTGFAYRPADSNRWNALGRYELRYETDDAVSSGLRRVVHILTTGANYQPIRPFVASGRYAIKHARETSDGLSDTIIGQMVTGRATWDLTKRWDLGLNLNALMVGKNSVSYGVGNEVGYLLTANLWLSAGFNYFGFFDRDLSGEDYTAPGLFVRFRFKFDEHLFDRGKLDAPADTPPPAGEGEKR